MSEYKKGTCTWCRDVGTVYADNNRCEDCDREVFRCTVCDQEYHRDDKCRHIFQDADYEWTGAGGYIPSDTVKDSFFDLLTAMPDGFADALNQAIQSKKFHTWFVAPLIGGGAILTLYGMPDHRERSWGDYLCKVLGEDAEEIIQDGYRWLVSLCDDRTPTANRLTIGWISEWTRRAPERALRFWAV